jgi:hypothetical protein
MDRDQFTEIVKGKAEQNFRTHGHLAAVVLAVQPQGIAAELLPMDDKDTAARLIQRVRATSPLVAVVAESWYVDLSKLSQEQHRQAMDVPPSRHPKRKEVAMVTIHHGLDTTAYAADIIRSGRKKPVLGPWKVLPMAGA